MRNLVDALRSSWPEDVASSIRTADDAIAQSFIFDQRWDMERTYVKEHFEGEIDFLHQPGDDPEWIYAFNRLRHFICLAQAYVLTGDGKYSTCLADQMRLWIEKVRPYDEASAKAWRTIETGIRLDTFTKAWLIAGSSPQMKAIEPIFMKSVEEHAAFILANSWNSYHLMSNWGVLSNHGLYLAACAFGREDWRKEALRRLSLELLNEVYDDGTQWEQSPMYHNEVLRDYLDVILFSRLYGHQLEDWFLYRVHKMALVDLKWIKPNGSEPMMGDSDDIDMRDLVSEAAYIFSDGALKGVGYPVLDYETSFLVGQEGIAQYEAIEARTPELLDYILEDSGNVACRDGWSPDSSWIRFHNGTLGAGHGHADQSHISFVDRGRDFLVDAGRFSYVFGEGRKAFKDMRAHNVVVVDGIELYPEKDSWECHSLAKAIGTRASFKGDDIAFEGGHLGYQDRGVFVNRKAVWMKEGRLLVVIDEFHASGRHSYDQLWHFAEDLVPQVEGNVVEVGDVRITQLSRQKLDLSVIDSRISRHYNESTPNLCLSTKLEAEGFASLVTVFDFGDAKVSASLTDEVRSNFKGIVFPPETIEAVELAGPDRDYVLVVAHKEYATPTDTFLAADCTGFGQLTLFNRKAGERSIGKRLFC